MPCCRYAVSGAASIASYQGNGQGSSTDVDLEVAMATDSVSSVLSREPSVGSSFSDVNSRVVETPSDDFSDEDYDRSSPLLEIS